MLFIHANLVTMEPAPQGFLSIPDGFLLTEGSCIAALGPDVRLPGHLCLFARGGL